MGLVFQSRAVIHCGKPVSRETFARPRLWHITGRNRTFLHFCQEGKWASFEGAQETHENLAALRSAFGFFSLTADYLDLPDRDRAYVLHRETLREVDAQKVTEEKRTPPGLYQHFDWCRRCFYQVAPDHPDSSFRFEAWWPPGSSERVPPPDTLADVAGWFRVHEQDSTGFDDLVSLFPGDVATVATASLTGARYLFMGEEVMGEEAVALIAYSSW